MPRYILPVADMSMVEKAINSIICHTMMNQMLIHEMFSNIREQSNLELKQG